MELTLGVEYKRSAIHDSLGGNRQAGISPLRDGEKILLFSSDSGSKSGYRDKWDDEFFYYTGAGRTGNQDVKAKRHNLHILTHKEEGKRILLMVETRPSFYRYEAELTLDDYDYFETNDKDGSRRWAVIFIFKRSGATERLSDSNNRSGPTRPYKRPHRTSRQGLVTSRVGQGWYRQALLEKFDRKCAVLGSGPERILIASHIVPWSESNDDERLDVENGILLSPVYDALFDRNLISFNSNGLILISKALKKDEYEVFGVSGKERIAVTEGMQSYLMRHQQKLDKQ